ncbi:ABC transporter permease [Bacteroidota bacterium]
MKIFAVIRKSLIEQLRNFWILVLTVSIAPFFVFVYYLIDESSKPNYNILIDNRDEGLNSEINYGDYFIRTLNEFNFDSLHIGFNVQEIQNKEKAIELLIQRKADSYLKLPANFSEKLEEIKAGIKTAVDIEIAGDVSNIKYIMSAVWTEEVLKYFMYSTTETLNPICITEDALGISAEKTDFDYFVPGLIILAIVMLMFSASLAIVSETEKQTIKRLKISEISSFQFLSGVSIVQILLGFLSVFLTLMLALELGFNIEGSLGGIIFIIFLSCLSIIAFSLILAALTKTSNEILVVGNFPLFLFMFFTGSMFPLNTKTLFSLGNYDMGINFVLSATHGVSALNKLLNFDSNLTDILPEIYMLVLTTAVYFVIGIWVYYRRNLKTV